MIKRLLLLLLVFLVAGKALATENNSTPAECVGMAKALKLPDDKVFQTFVDLENMQKQKQYGHKSDEHLKGLFIQANDRGYGRGIAEGAIKAYGTDFAFNLFMLKCYDNDYKAREKALAVEKAFTVEKVR